MNGRIRASNFLFHLFLVCTALMPFVSLFWQINFLSLKLNWILYPVMVLGVFFSIFFRQKTSGVLFLLVGLSVLYLIAALVGNGEVETILRFLISLIPLALYTLFTTTAPSPSRLFWWLYIASFAVPIYFAVLQYTGRMPYYEFDFIDDESVGRISGGYNKPMNFIAFLLPLYLYGFYLWRVLGKTKSGLLLIVLILGTIYIIGHRTSLFAFVLIFCTSFLDKATVKGIILYYRYFLNFFIGIVSFVFFRLLLLFEGTVDFFRGRGQMWEAQSYQFFDSSLATILFGSQRVFLTEKYEQPGIASTVEVHNNSFRTILVFGIVGFFLYCVLVRSVVLQVAKEQYAGRLRFVVFSSFTYFIFYTVTNEPVYYGSVLWPILIWIFLALPYSRKKLTEL